MLFFHLENQFYLVITLVFSSYLLLSSLIMKIEDAGVKAFGLAFFIPLALTVVSFFTAPHYKIPAEAMLLLSQLALVLVTAAIFIIKKGLEALKLFIPAPFVLGVLLVFVARSSFYEELRSALPVVFVAVLFILLLLAALSLFLKGKDSFLPIAGIFLLTAAHVIWLMSGELTMEALVSLTLGYGLCSWHFYQQSYGVFFKEYKENRAALLRMNNSLQLEVIRRVEEIEKSNRKLLEISKTDSMTGLYVKSAVLNNLAAILERSPLSSLSVLMFDIDHFKQINDSMGHQVGDRSIKNISSLVQGSFRNDDILGRYGGDEFIVLLPSTPPVKAFIIADRFRQIVETQANPKVTISAGISSFPDDGKTAADLIEAADKALYASKQKGRNQVTLYSSLVSKMEENSSKNHH